MGIPWRAMSEPVRVHLRVPGTAPMPDLMRLLRSIEAAGFDGAGILDSQMISRDTFVVLGQAAASTSRLTLFPAVTNPFTRHASVLASATQTVEELAPGRVKFVIGTGYTSASTIGRKPATLAEMRACIGAVRALLAGETVDFDGTSGRLGYASKRRIPLVMAASGPKAIELAGEIADGGLPLPKLDIPDAVWKIYPDLSHAHDWEAAIAATSFVPDDVVAQLCDAIGLVGTPADCAARIVEMTKLGARNLYLMPLLTFGLPEPELAAFRDVVFPRLAVAGVRPAR